MMTNEHTPALVTATELRAMVESLVIQLAEYEKAAATIRATLADLRKHLAGTPGARAGKQARSGKRARKAPPIEVTDLRAPEVQ